jgi:hypothetical protein
MGVETNRGIGLKQQASFFKINVILRHPGNTFGINKEMDLMILVLDWQISASFVLDAVYRNC